MEKKLLNKTELADSLVHPIQRESRKFFKVKTIFYSCPTHQVTKERKIGTWVTGDILFMETENKC